jgi:Protein of unknown function (DUF2865)
VRILKVLLLTASATASPVANTALPFSIVVPVQHQSLISTVGLFDWLFGGSQTPPEQPTEPKGRSDEDGRTTRGRRSEGDPGSYRTVCVRLCDGFYFPISFATTRGRLRDDAETCERQCPSRSRLFFFRGTDQTVDEMVDLDGQRYVNLAAAFRFRDAYVANCTCRGNPWDPEELARHAEYARTTQPAVATASPAPSKETKTRRRARQTYGYRARQDAD